MEFVYQSRHFFLVHGAIYFSMCNTLICNTCTCILHAEAAGEGGVVRDAAFAVPMSSWSSEQQRLIQSGHMTPFGSSRLNEKDGILLSSSVYSIHHCSLCIIHCTYVCMYVRMYVCTCMYVALYI